MKIDRLIGILSILLQQERVTAPYLAEKFEVSRRTIQRDIESLCQAGIPLATAQGAGGGISLVEGYRVDRTLLTSRDRQAILEGLRSLDSVSGTNRYAQLMEKLAAGSSDLMPGDAHILIDLSSWSKEAVSPKIEAVHRAMEEGRCLQFRYFAPRGESDRVIEPGYLIFHWANWYVWGFCRQREDYRLFKLNRMAELRLGENHERRPVPLPDLSTERVFPRLFPVRARVAPAFRWRLLEEFGPDSFTEQEDGWLLFSFSFADEENALRWILSFQGGAELLEPAACRENLAAVGRQLQQQYGQ